MALWSLFILYVVGSFSGRIEARGVMEDVSGLAKETEALSRWQYLYTQFNVLVIYIRLLFLPIGQSLDHLYPYKSGFLSGYTPAVFLFLTGISVLGIMEIKKRPVISFGIFWFFITLSVESSIIPIKDALVEHRLYLPMFGFSLIATYLVFDLTLHRGFWAIVICVSTVLVFGTAAYFRNRVWQEEIKLWVDVISKNPKNNRGHHNLGLLLAKQGKVEQAIGHYYLALRIKPDHADVHFNLGNAFKDQGRFKEALNHYSEAFRILPDYAEAHNNMGLALVESGRIPEAVDQYSEALRINPEFKEALFNLGNALSRQGRTTEAIQHFSKALEIDPEDADVYNNLGIALADQGETALAIEHYSQALTVKPDFSEAHYNMANALADQGLTGEAVEHYEKALDIHPQFIPALNNLSMIYAISGKNDKALTLMKRIVDYQPEQAETYYNIACIYARQNKRDQAIDWFQKAIERGYNNWDLIKTDKDLENIRDSSMYKELIEDH